MNEQPGLTRFPAVVSEQVAMVGAHRDFGVGAPLGAAAVLLRHQRRYKAHDVGFASKMVGLEKRAVRLPLDVAQMGEMHARLRSRPRHGSCDATRCDADRAGLADIFEADRIVRPKPAPGLQQASPCYPTGREANDRESSPRPERAAMMDSGQVSPRIPVRGLLGDDNHTFRPIAKYFSARASRSSSGPRL